MLDAHHIVQLQQQAVAGWHGPAQPPSPVSAPLDALVLDQHLANFELWHHEDAARDPLAADASIVGSKRAIDTVNQRRNDLVERIDTILLKAVPPNATAPLHSETPGMMIDRLSVLALKIFHTEEETRRPDASPLHHQRNRDRLAVLQQQRDDLAAALDRLWQDVLAGRGRFKLYRQMKMYNDPELNPVLYRRHSASDD